MKKEAKIVFDFSGRYSGMTIQMMSLILRADRQGQTIYTNSQSMYDALTEKGIKTELIELPGDYMVRADDLSQSVIDERLRNPQKTKTETLYWSMYDTKYLQRQ